MANMTGDLLGGRRGDMSDRLGPFLLGPNDTPENGIYTGDAKILSKAIPDESVDLIFCDPVYQNIEDYRWLAETGARVLKKQGFLLCFYANELLLQITEAMEIEELRFIRNLVIFHSGITVGKFIGRFFSKTTPCLAYGKDRRSPKQRMWDISIASSNRRKFGLYHKWGKDPVTIDRWLRGFTNADEIVWDPFSGSSVIAAVCKMLNRRYLAFEIDPDVAEAARRRVRETQSPLPGINVEQGTLLSCD